MISFLNVLKAHRQGVSVVQWYNMCLSCWKTEVCPSALPKIQKKKILPSFQTQGTATLSTPNSSGRNTANGENGSRQPTTLPHLTRSIREDLCSKESGSQPGYTPINRRGAGLQERDIQTGFILSLTKAKMTCKWCFHPHVSVDRHLNYKSC